MTIDELDRVLGTIKLGLLSMAMRDEIPLDLFALDMDAVFDEGKKIVEEGKESWH